MTKLVKRELTKPAKKRICKISEKRVDETVEKAEELTESVERRSVNGGIGGNGGVGGDSGYGGKDTWRAENFLPRTAKTSNLCKMQSKFCDFRAFWQIFGENAQHIIRKNGNLSIDFCHSSCYNNNTKIISCYFCVNFTKGSRL